MYMVPWKRDITFKFSIINSNFNCFCIEQYVVNRETLQRTFDRQINVCTECDDNTPAIDI